MTKRLPTRQETASALYETRHAEFCRRMALPMRAVESHHVSFLNDGGRNYGSCGDLGHVNELLADGLSFLNVEGFTQR